MRFIPALLDFIVGGWLTVLPVLKPAELAGRKLLCIAEAFPDDCGRCVPVTVRDDSFRVPVRSKRAKPIASVRGGAVVAGSAPPPPAPPSSPSDSTSSSSASTGKRRAELELDRCSGEDDASGACDPFPAALGASLKTGGVLPVPPATIDPLRSALLSLDDQRDYVL